MSGLSKGFFDPSIASTSQEGQVGVEKRTLRVTLLSSEWRSSTHGDVSTINRELAIQLAKHPDVQVSVFVPQCSDEDKNSAAYHKVQLIEAEKMTGVDPVDWLIVPQHHDMDCIIGHGVHLGRQILLIKRQHHHCKWIQVVHTAPEELGMYKSISEGEQMHQIEIELCEKADQVVAVEPKLADAYKRYLRSGKKQQDVLDLTPSIFTEFLEVKQATEERNTFCVLVIGCGDHEDFNLKGYDLAAQAIAEMKDKSYQLRFICAPTGKGGEIAEKLLEHGIARNQLIVRSFNESREVLARLFCEVDLAIMPSRTEGFGLTALEALSAGLPILVSDNSGLAVALKKVPTGSTCVVDSEDPKHWAKAIRSVREKDRDVRLAESRYLCEKYLEKYSWQEPCGCLVKKMWDLLFEDSSQNWLTSTVKDKRPLPLFSTQPSKRVRQELTEHDPHEDQYWDENGPIFFYTGNEGPIEGFWDNSGFVFEAAAKFNALVIFGEHRYYGESMPFGSASFDHDKVGYLAVEQAMADFAVLVTELKIQFKATKSKVVAFGGSYGGMLSAYMRFKYPNVIDAALAASAPIYMIAFKGSEREFFFSAVTKDFFNADPNCPGYVITAFEMLEMLKNQGSKGLAELSKIFKLCKPLESTEQIHHMLGWIRNSFTNLAMGDYPYPTNFLAPLPGDPVNKACGMMKNASSKLQGLADVTAIVYNGTNGTLPCLDPDTEYIECADPTGCGLGADSVAWDYQACTELPLPAGSNNKTDMFPPLPWTPDMRAKYCQEKWGVVQRPDWATIQFWGKDISSASNIIFSNGDLDPWRPGGVLEDVSPTLVAVLVKGGAHHLDLRASNPQDPRTVKQAREQELELIKKFIQ